MIGWKQDPTIIEEDNQACVYYSKTTYMTRNLRHLSLAEAYAKEKVQDGTAVIKVASEDNNSDIGTVVVPGIPGLRPVPDLVTIHPILPPTVHIHP